MSRVIGNPARASAFETVHAFYQDRSLRARQVRDKGVKIVGYMCCFVPLEIFTALGLMPFRIQGNIHEAVSEGDQYLESNSCPFVRSCFDLAMKGRYDFLDGLVIPHSCDTVQRLYDIWRVHRKPSFTHCLNVPHILDSSSLQFFRKELEGMAQKLEQFAGKSLTSDNLRQAANLHNRNRGLLRDLYELRKSDPPLVSGSEVFELAVAGMGLPVHEFNDLITAVIDEAKSRACPPELRTARILVFGSELDDVALVSLIEECGANVVMDDTCTGSRPFYRDVDTSGDLFDALTKRYLETIHCPRTYVPQGKNRQDDLEGRFGYLKDFIRDYHVNGVILNVTMYCDTYELDAPDVNEYLAGMGIPVLRLEDAYTSTGMGQIKTRVQAFVEMID